MADPKELVDKSKAILESRGQSYGDYRPLYRKIARRWSDALQMEISPSMVCRLLCEMKLARWENSGYNEDHAIDAANYLFLAGSLEKLNE